MRARHLFSAFLCIISVFIVPGCAKAPEPPIRVGLGIWPAFEIPFLARDLGYYEGVPVELVTYETPAEAFRAYRNGLIDVFPMTADYFLQLVANDPNHYVVLVIDISHGGDSIVARPDCPGLGVSKKCNVGLEGSAIGAYVLARALELEGKTLSDVSTLYVDIPDQEQAFIDGKLDIVVTFEPTRSNLLNRGAIEIFNSSQIPGEIVDVLIAPKDLVRERPEELRAFIRGWLKARTYLEEHPADAAKRVAGREGVSPEQYQESLAGVILPDEADNLRMLGGDSPELLETLRRLSHVMVDAGMLKQGVDPEGLLIPTLLPGGPR